MQTVESIYRESVLPLRDAEKLQLAAKILSDLSKSQANKSRSAVEMLDAMSSGRLFKTAEEANEYLRRERESWES